MTNPKGSDNSGTNPPYVTDRDRSDFLDSISSFFLIRVIRA